VYHFSYRAEISGSSKGLMVRIAPSRFDPRENDQLIPGAQSPGQRVSLRDLPPIHHVPPGSDVIGAAVLVFQVVGMFPDVEAEQWGVPEG
jgi:hypothetical protein